MTFPKALRGFQDEKCTSFFPVSVNGRPNGWKKKQKNKCVCLFAERHDALYVVGALEEAMELRGMRYHPIDIETSVIRTHKSITEW